LDLVEVVQAAFYYRRKDYIHLITSAKSNCVGFITVVNAYKGKSEGHKAALRWCQSQALIKEEGDTYHLCFVTASLNSNHGE